MGLKIGDKVKAAVYPEAVVGHVTKIVGRCIFIDVVDAKGRALCVDAKAVSLVPGSETVKRFEALH